jgi:hypothetical protein
VTTPHINHYFDPSTGECWRQRVTGNIVGRMEYLEENEARRATEIEMLERLYGKG